jgi:D-glycero-alpha-D-manno-heptose 1-phosphate guanylyltransferase
MKTGNNINITAAILSGGLGTRLRPVVKDRPKVLSDVMGRCFLTYILDQLASAGIQDVVLCTGYQSEMIPRVLGNSYKALNLIYSKEEKPLGTCGALCNALPHFRNNYILVMNGDSYMNFQIKEYLNWFFRIDRQASVALTQVADVGRYGKVVISDNQAVCEFTEKGMDHGPGWINAGVYILKKTLLESLPSGTPCSMEHDFFPDLIGKGLYGFPATGEFLDIGTPDTYQQAENFFREIISSTDMRSDQT